MGMEQSRKKTLTLFSNSLSFAFHLLQPARPQTFEDLSQVNSGGKSICLDKVGFSQKVKAYLNGEQNYAGSMSSTMFHFCLVEKLFLLLLKIKEK